MFAGWSARVRSGLCSLNMASDSICWAGETANSELNAIDSPAGLVSVQILKDWPEYSRFAKRTRDVEAAFTVCHRQSIRGGLRGESAPSGFAGLRILPALHRTPKLRPRAVGVGLRLSTALLCSWHPTLRRLPVVRRPGPSAVRPDSSSGPCPLSVLRRKTLGGPYPKGSRSFLTHRSRV